MPPAEIATTGPGPVERRGVVVGDADRPTARRRRDRRRPRLRRERRARRIRSPRWPPPRRGRPRTPSPWRRGRARHRRARERCCAPRRGATDRQPATGGKLAVNAAAQANLGERPVVAREAEVRSERRVDEPAGEPRDVERDAHGFEEERRDGNGTSGGGVQARRAPSRSGSGCRRASIAWSSSRAHGAPGRGRAASATATTAVVPSAGNDVAARLTSLPETTTGGAADCTGACAWPCCAWIWSALGAWSAGPAGRPERAPWSRSSSSRAAGPPSSSRSPHVALCVGCARDVGRDCAGDGDRRADGDACHSAHAPARGVTGVGCTALVVHAPHRSDAG